MNEKPALARIVTFARGIIGGVFVAVGLAFNWVGTRVLPRADMADPETGPNMLYRAIANLSVHLHALGADEAEIAEALHQSAMAIEAGILHGQIPNTAPNPKQIDLENVDVSGNA